MRSLAIQARPDLYWSLGRTAEAEWEIGFLIDNFAFSPRRFYEMLLRSSNVLGFSSCFPSLGFILGDKAARDGWEKQVPHRAYRPIRNDIDILLSALVPPCMK